MRALQTILAVSFFLPAYGQTTIKESYQSELLNETRTISIHVPSPMADSTAFTSYSLIIVLDAEFLFYPVVGAVEGLSFRGLAPPAIVLGIHQNNNADANSVARWKDCDYDENTGELTKAGSDFYGFINQEILPYIEDKYSISPFKAIVGHSFTANYLNYFFTDDSSKFNGFACFSPFIPTVIEPVLANSIQNLSSPKYYFLCTEDLDLSAHLNQIAKQDSVLFSTINNPNFNYSYEKYANENHMSLPLKSCIDAINHLFSGYQPLYCVTDKIQLPDDHLYEFLENRYNQMERVYGCDLKMREDDLLEIAWIAEEKELWEELNEIGQIFLQLYPESVYGYYIIASYFEHKNDFSNALIYYKDGYKKLGQDILNKADFYIDIERVEKLIETKNHDEK